MISANFSRLLEPVTSCVKHGDSMVSIGVYDEFITAVLQFDLSG
jgi:hypothetical protein